jgi:hypothetical protein
VVKFSLSNSGAFALTASGHIIIGVLLQMWMVL